MEQKHLDEMDEDSFFGEEFIDNEEDYPVLKVGDKAKKEGKKMEERKVEEKKVSAPIKPKLTVSTPKRKEFDDEIIVEEVKIKPARMEPSKPEPVKESFPANKSSDPDRSGPRSGSNSSGGESSSGVAIWQVISLLLVIGLVAAILTGGFGYEVSAPMAAEELSLDQAAAKVEEYVNTQILTPPWTAEVQKKEDAGHFGMYKVTLTVAGNNVESYITKDGKIFFPRGLDLTNFSATASLEETKTPAGKNTSVSETPAAPNVTLTPVSPEKPVEEKPVPPVSTVPPVVSSISLGMNAKKWLFDPNTLSVAVGQKVQLEIAPSADLGEFTFAIPDLGVEQKVSGKTTIEFTPAKAGTFAFLCSSCETWRGMQGTLEVK
ncbi:MAG: cupredoxin domain-containing protein [Nanoarchaeota archaeon]